MSACMTSGRVAGERMHKHVHDVRPRAYHGRNGPAQRPNRDRRVRGRRHGDERPGRRRLRADRGGCCTGGRWGAPRPLELAGANERAAPARDPALHRHYPDDGRRRAVAGDGAAAAGGVAARPRDGRPQRGVRPPCAAPGVRADRPRVAQPAGDLHGRAGASDAPAAAPAGPDRARRCARDRGRGSPPCAAGRRNMCARPLRAAAAAVRKRVDGGRRAQGARAKAAPATRPLAARADGSLLGPGRRPRRARARLCPAAARPGRVPVSRRRGPCAVRRQVDLDPQPGAGTLRPVGAAGGLDRARVGRRLPHDALRTRGAGAREPADQGARAAGEQAPHPPGRPARVHPLPARHPVPDPRGQLRSGAGTRGYDRSAAWSAAGA